MTRDTAHMPLDERGLAPCPFCGGEAKHFTHDPHGGWSNTDSIQCTNEECGAGTCLHETKEIAVKLWNRRAYLQTAAADVSGLVERLGHSAAFAFPVVQEAASTLGAQAAELAAVKTKASYWQAEYLNACRDAASFSDDLMRAEAALAEARKALEQAEQQLDYGQVDAAHRIINSAISAPKGGQDHG